MFSCGTKQQSKAALFSSSVHRKSNHLFIFPCYYPFIRLNTPK